MWIQGPGSRVVGDVLPDVCAFVVVMAGKPPCSRDLPFADCVTLAEGECVARTQARTSGDATRLQRRHCPGTQSSGDIVTETHYSTKWEWYVGTGRGYVLSHTSWKLPVRECRLEACGTGMQAGSLRYRNASWKPALQEVPLRVAGRSCARLNADLVGWRDIARSSARAGLRSRSPGSSLKLDRYREHGVCRRCLQGIFC
jgi:hypothetical protein